MIPRVIHYCWFGGKPLPRSARRYIASWKKFFPNYEIKQWNETNYNVNVVPYTKEAYEQGKYAFVSDYARFDILYRYGGLYFDTDVEVIKKMDDIVERGAFLGMEEDKWVAPGLAMGTEAGNNLYKEMLDYYATLHYTKETITMVVLITDMLKKYGLVPSSQPQQIYGNWIYPNDYFNPLDDATGRMRKTKNTRSIHWYAKTWVDNYGPIRNWTTRWIHRFFGVDSLKWIKKYFK